VEKSLVHKLITRQRMWWLTSTITGFLTALATKSLIKTAYRLIQKEAPETAFDPDRAGFSWPNFLVWALAAGMGLGATRVMSNRLATAEWKFFTGAPPPQGD
jgi:hypothetical protein